MKRNKDTLSITEGELWTALRSVGIDENKIRIRVFDTVESTNTVAKEMAEENSREGIPTLVIANGQTGGRGRLGRSFSCPYGAGIYMSLLFYPRLPASMASRLTCLTAVATARAIDKISGIRPFIKWVNDLYVGDKKLCGILTEGCADSDGILSFAVIGIGINVHEADLGEFSDIATNLEREGAREIKRCDLVAGILQELFPMLAAEDTTEYFREYIDRASPIIGRRVTVRRGDESYPATVKGIEPNGKLCVMTDSGKTVLLESGEVTLSFKA